MGDGGARRSEGDCLAAQRTFGGAATHRGQASRGSRCARAATRAAPPAWRGSAPPRRRRASSRTAPPSPQPGAPAAPARSPRTPVQPPPSVRHQPAGPGAHGSARICSARFIGGRCTGTIRVVYPGTLFHRRQRGIPMHSYENRGQIRALAPPPPWCVVAPFSV
jgi:hypothetical protein